MRRVAIGLAVVAAVILLCACGGPISALLWPVTPAP